MRRISLAVVAGIASLLPTAGFGALVPTVTSGSTATPLSTSGAAIDAAQSDAGFVVRSTDLVNAGQPTLLSVSSSGSTPTDPNRDFANDGNANFSNGAATGLGTGATLGVWTLIYTLDTSVNTLGYNITQIDTGAGGTDEDRTNQSFELFVRPVGTSNFVSLGTFDTGARVANVANGTGTSTARATGIRITDPDDGFVAEAVDAIRFDFSMVSGQLQATAYREIDVQGAAVPEPSTAAVVGLCGLLALTSRRFRKPVNRI